MSPLMGYNFNLSLFQSIQTMRINQLNRRGGIFNNLKVQAGKPEVGFGGEELNKIEFYVNFMKWHVVFRIAIHVLIRYPRPYIHKTSKWPPPTHLPPAQRSSKVTKTPSIRYLVFTSKATINILDTYTLSETVSITISSVHHR